MDTNIYNIHLFLKFIINCDYPLEKNIAFLNNTEQKIYARNKVKIYCIKHFHSEKKNNKQNDECLYIYNYIYKHAFFLKYY